MSFPNLIFLCQKTVIVSIKWKIFSACGSFRSFTRSLGANEATWNLLDSFNVDNKNVDFGKFKFKFLWSSWFSQLEIRRDTRAESIESQLSFQTV